MSKVFGILLIVVALWAGMEIYSEGTTNAFGGALVTAGLVDPESAGAEQSSIRRSGAKVAGAHSQSEARRNRLLAE